jgi:predicted nucleic acid-binding protein
MSIYLDASCLIPLFVPDAHGTSMEHWAAKNREPILVSDFAAAEFAAVISRLVRMNQLAKSAALVVLADFDSWRGTRTVVRFAAAADIAACDRLIRNFSLKLLVPDALHLAIAIADGATLITLDERLASAARTLNHPVVIPGA